MKGGIVAKLYSKIERLKKWIVFFIEKYQPICGICGGEIDWISFFPLLSNMIRDAFTVHHKNHIPKDNRPQNKLIVHRSCHRRLHREWQILKEQGRKIITYFCYENVGGVFIKQKIRIPISRVNLKEKL